jgi:hypothetical protein
VIGGPELRADRDPAPLHEPLINSVEAVKKDIDQVFVLRAVQSRFAPESTYQQLAEVVASAKIQRLQGRRRAVQRGRGRRLPAHGAGRLAHHLAASSAASPWC